MPFTLPVATETANPIPRRVLVLFSNQSQASFRLRIAALKAPLAERGVHFIPRQLPRGLIGRLRLLHSADDYDAVILQRRLLSITLLRLLRKRAKCLIYDIDDALWEPNRPLGAVAERRTRQRFEVLATLVDHVAAGSEHLAEAFQRRGASAKVIPTVLNPNDYQTKRHTDTPSPRLVWIGSRSTLPYLDSLRPALAESVRRMPQLELVTIADATLDPPPSPIRHIAWSGDGEAADLLEGDIGIAPTPDDPFTRGKCGFKILQYMAAGLPTIASPVGANAQIVIDRRTGFHAKTDHDWFNAIERLARDVDLRRSFGVAGRSRVASEYSIEVATKRWVELLASDERE